jgi:hypothetical protein
MAMRWIQFSAGIFIFTTKSRAHPTFYPLVTRGTKQLGLVQLTTLIWQQKMYKKYKSKWISSYTLIFLNPVFFLNWNLVVKMPGIL